MSIKKTMTTFDSKTKEVARNAAMISERIQVTVDTVGLLRQFSQDLEILSLELDLDDNERAALKNIKQSVEDKMEQVVGHLNQAQSLCVEIAEGFEDFKPYLGRTISNPFKPIFSGKVSSQLIELGRQETSLRPHIRVILANLKES